MVKKNKSIIFLVLLQILVTVVLLYFSRGMEKPFLQIFLLADAVLALLMLKELLAVRKDIGKLSENLFIKPESRLLRREILHLSKAQEEIREQADMESKYKEIQLRTLMNQIDPHFLYNTLDSIRGQALSSDDYIVADMTETLSKFFRYGITQKGVVVSIEEEVESVNLYLKIINFRMAGKFDFKCEIEDRELLEYQIPKLTIQPIIENALLHGIYDYKTGGIISLRIQSDANMICIFIHDNGQGLSSEKLAEINQKLNQDGREKAGDSKKQEGGIALPNINQRIRILYGEIYGVHVYSTEGVGTTVQVVIPKLKK